MDILSFPISLDQLFIPGHMSQHTKLDLRIVCVKEHTPVLRYKYLSDQSSQLHANRNILKVRFCAADASCGSDRLIKSRMDPSVFFNYCAKAVCIGGFQLCKLPVFKNIIYNRLLRSQFFQNICRCGISGFCLSSSRNPHFFKKYYSKLLRRVNIKFLSRLFVDQLFQLTDPDAESFAICFQFLSFYADSAFFHGIQSKYKRKFNVRINLPHSCFLKLCLCFLPGSIGSKRLIAGTDSQIFGRFFPGFFIGIFSKKLFPGWNTDSSDILSGNVLVSIRGFQRIQKISPDSKIKYPFRFQRFHVL